MSDEERERLIHLLSKDTVIYEAILTTINLFRMLACFSLRTESVEENRKNNFSCKERFGPKLKVRNFNCASSTVFMSQLESELRQMIICLRHPELYHPKKSTKASKQSKSKKRVLSDTE